MSNYLELKKINVNDKIEKKNNLSYLSWAWAVDQLLTHDATATWEYKEPQRFGETLMVFCTVTAFGKSMTAQLPVMDYRNKAIPNPDAFAVNTAMQRCLAKAISLHGIGLYIYAGEDLPDDDKTGSQKVLDKPANEPPTPERMEELKESAAEIVDFHVKGLHEDMFIVYDNISDMGEREALWTLLKPNADVRAKLKEIGQQKRKAA